MQGEMVIENAQVARVRTEQWRVVSGEFPTAALGVDPKWALRPALGKEEYPTPRQFS
jgi:hypothetical protein